MYFIKIKFESKDFVTKNTIILKAILGILKLQIVFMFFLLISALNYSLFFSFMYIVIHRLQAVYNFLR